MLQRVYIFQTWSYPIFHNKDNVLELSFLIHVGAVRKMLPKLNIKCRLDLGY